jgi:flagellar biosynthesis/type III secretory pathway ATPase
MFHEIMRLPEGSSAAGGVAQRLLDHLEKDPKLRQEIAAEAYDARVKKSGATGVTRAFTFELQAMAMLWRVAIGEGVGAGAGAGVGVDSNVWVW